MSFTAKDPLHQGTLKNIAFFPDLSLLEFQKSYDIDGEVGQETLNDVLTNAVILVNDNLKQYTKAKQQEGYETLDEIPDDRIGVTQAEDQQAEHRLITLYKQAVYNRAKADFLHDFANYKLTDKGERNLNDSRSLADDYYRQSTAAIRRIKGKSSVRTRLI